MIKQAKLPNPELAWKAIAEKLRFGYWSRRNLTSGSGNHELWYELAKEITARVISPRLFMEAQFQSLRTVRRPPSPQALLARSAFERYELYREKNQSEIVHSLAVNLASQTAIARREVVVQMTFGEASKEDAVRYALNYQGHQITAMFGYLLAKDTGGKLLKWADDYFVDAVLQYVPLRNEYEQAWGSIIPSDFRTDAPRAYTQMFTADCG